MKKLWFKTIKQLEKFAKKNQDVSGYYQKCSDGSYFVLFDALGISQPE
jgi:hypothetical protein